MKGQVLTQEQILAGKDTLGNEKTKLTPDQVDDLVSIFRVYLGTYAGDYNLRNTFESLTDSDSSNKAAKLAACLLLWQDNQFDVSEFVATATNKTGFSDSTPLENFEIFKYAFTLFWDLPFFIANRFTTGNGNGFVQGKFKRVVK